MEDGHVVDETQLEVEVVGDCVDELRADGGEAWALGGLHDGRDDVGELILVDGLVVGAIGGVEDGVGDPGA